MSDPGVGPHRGPPRHPARHGPPPGWVPPGGRWWRRRFLRFLLVGFTVWLALGLLFGGPWRDRGGPGAERRGAAPAFLFLTVGVAVAATAFAYRRLAGPVSDLLDGAERIGHGDYDHRVEPAGPRSVRTLGAAFNEMATRLDASETARQRFLADVTHELRTPLTVLRGELELQRDGIHDRSDATLRLLLDQTATLERLVEDLRTLSLGDAGQLVLHPERVALGVVVEDVATAQTASAIARGVTIVLDPPPAPVVLDADPVRLGQVLANVLTNAIRHSPRGGTITLAWRTGGGWAEVTVTDQGPGVGPDPERVFDRFARAADSGGTGLGLTIARQLVTAHGGTITAADTPTGPGARFTIRLPHRL